MTTNAPPPPSHPSPNASAAPSSAAEAVASPPAAGSVAPPPDTDCGAKRRQADAASAPAVGSVAPSPAAGSATPPPIRFASPKLEASFREALELLDGYDFASAETWDDEITESTLLDLVISRCDDAFPIKATDLIGLVQEVSDTKNISFDGLTYHSPHRTVIRLEPVDARAALFIDEFERTSDPNVVSKVTLDGHELSVGLVRASLHFVLTMLQRGYFYDKYMPPLSGDELFLEVQHPSAIKANKASEVGYAYLFELSSLLDLRFSLSPRPSSQHEYPDSDEIEGIKNQAQRLRPLLLGAGLGPLLREFHRGTVSQDAETSLVCFVKCIEYVSATVVRERQYDDIRKRLQSPLALSPTAAYIDDLLALFEENRIFTKDHEALKLTVDRCCDPILLSQYAPKCVASLCAIKSSSKAADRKGALADLSACLSATRNLLAHAKANYELTGKECPSDQLPQLVACARIAAEQCVRWYAVQNPDLRRG